MEMDGEFNTVNSPNWMMSVLHRCLFLQTEQPKEDDIARCKCMRQLALPVFLCGKGSKGFAVTAVVLGLLQVSYTLDAVEADPSK